MTATGLIRACEEAGRLEDACSLFRALVPQAPGPDPFPSLPKERGGAPLAPNEEAADSGEGRAATGALGRGPAPQEDARPPEVGPSPNSSPETSTSTSPSPSISPSTSPNASLRSGQGQGEVSGGLPADELGGRRGRAKRARGRKGRREGQGGTASESPPSVVVVPNIIMCNVMLKMYGKTGRFKDACWMMDQVLLPSLPHPPCYLSRVLQNAPSTVLTVPGPYSQVTGHLCPFGSSSLHLQGASASEV